MSPSERSEILLALKQYLSVLSSKPGRFGVRGETCYWTSGYHVNIRLYMKLLFGLFDILEDGQLVEVRLVFLVYTMFIQMTCTLFPLFVTGS